MKESIGGTWLFGIVIVFILLFTAIMCFTINQSKAIAVKSDLIDYIEYNEGIDISKELNSNAVKIINNAGYYTTGTCDEGYIGFDRTGKKVSTNPVLCIKEIPSNNETAGCYYDVELFYKLDLPVIESIFNFKVRGKTKELYKYCSTH